MRKENSEKLSEHVAEREQVQKTDWMREAFILQILLDVRLQRLDVRQDVAVRDNDSLGLGGCSRGEYDFKGVTWLQIGRCIGTGRMLGKDL